MNDGREGEQELTSAPYVVVGHVLLWRLIGAGNADLSRMIRQAAAAWRDVGRPILLWAVLEQQADLPSPSVQAALLRAATSLVNYCESVTLIVPGNEVGQILVRSTLRGLSMTSLVSKTMRIRVVEDFAAAAKAAGDPTLVATELERAAEEAGILGLVAGSLRVAAPT